MNENEWTVNVSGFQKISENEQIFNMKLYLFNICGSKERFSFRKYSVLPTLLQKHEIEPNDRETGRHFHLSVPNYAKNVEIFLRMLDDANKSK